MTRSTEGNNRLFLYRLKWGVLLWCAGVLGAGMLALPFHLLVKAAMSH
jgi:hypothetical protein